MDWFYSCNSIQILTGHERYSEIYLARGSVDNYYLPEANGRGKIVVVHTPEGQIDSLYLE